MAFSADSFENGNLHDRCVNDLFIHTKVLAATRKCKRYDKTHTQHERADENDETDYLQCIKAHVQAFC